MGIPSTPGFGKQKKGKGAPTKKKRRREKIDKGYIRVVQEPKRLRTELN